MKHRSVLGFAVPDQPVGELNCLADDARVSAVMATPSARFAMVEVCCLPQSSLRITCENQAFSIGLLHGFAMLVVRVCGFMFMSAHLAHLGHLYGISEAKRMTRNCMKNGGGSWVRLVII